MVSDAVELLIGARSVRLSSPNKVYFAELGLSKLAVAHYFESVGPGILAALRGRPTAMERWPSGVRTDNASAGGSPGSDGAFFQKRAPANTPEWVQTATVKFPSGRTAVEVAPADLATIIWMVNLGTLRFHPWPVRATDTEAVDQLRIDLDPQGVEFATVAKVALELRRVLDEAGLVGFCKTSGGRGVHVYASIRPTSFIAARHAVIAIGRELARRMPDQVSMSWWKEERGLRVFVDFNQMARDRLMTSAYSIRPTPAGLVSAPLEWAELAQVRPSDFSVLTMPARFAEYGDLWAGLDTASPGSLQIALDWFERDAIGGEGELPYPPEYPKMPGEPPRVQPSRVRKKPGVGSGGKPG